MVQIQAATGIPVPAIANRTRRQTYDASDVGGPSSSQDSHGLPPGTIPQGGSCKAQDLIFLKNLYFRLHLSSGTPRSSRTSRT